jgi:HAD superfamily hydrolase (TIGR01509 family)
VEIMIKNRPVDWVVFDLGETLVDETTSWGWWADQLEIPRLTFFAALGAVIAQRRPHTDVFELFRPGFDLASENESRRAASESPLTIDDLYADAVPTLTTLRERGYSLAVMANQPKAAETFMSTLPVEQFASSAGWGVSKPDLRFFERVAQELGVPPARIAYVGDRVDNDVLPAKAAGMLAVHLRRGPWGVVQGQWPEAAEADLRIDSLTELVRALDES